MKKIFWIVALVTWGYVSYAQENKCENTITDYTYCVVKRNGRTYVKRDGVKLDKDVKLTNGNIIRTEGVLETKDKFIVMEPNKCIHVRGRVVETKEELVTLK